MRGGVLAPEPAGEALGAPGSKPGGTLQQLQAMHSARCGGPGMIRFSTKVKAALLVLHTPWARRLACALA